MADELTVMLDGLLHYFGNKREQHGHINAKTSFAENVFLLAGTAFHLNTKYNAEQSHPDAALCEPLLTGNPQRVEQGIYRIAQSAPDEEFTGFCDTLADYAASISDRAKRKRAGELLFTLGRARAEAETGQASIASPFTRQQAQSGGRSNGGSYATSPLARGSRSALSPLTPFRARGFRAPLHPTTRGWHSPATQPDACRLWTPAQPCAVWMPPKGLSPWNPRQAFAPDTTTEKGTFPLWTLRAEASAPRHPRARRLPLHTSRSAAPAPRLPKRGQRHG